MEILPVPVTDTRTAEALTALSAAWKTPMRLWRVRLPAKAFAEEGEVAEGETSERRIAAAQLQRVQFRLAVDRPGDCPSTRWFSAPSQPLCAAMAAPLDAVASVQVADSHLGIRASFALDRRLAPSSLATGTGSSSSASAASARAAWVDQELKEAEVGDLDAAPRLPQGFCHTFVTRFQVRSRHSPRPPGDRGMPERPEDAPPGGSRRPPGVPWSEWKESPDAGLQAARISAEEGMFVHYSTDLILPNGEQLDYNSWYQVSTRVSDGITWSDWSAPSQPAKVFVSPPKAERPDTDHLIIERSDNGSNITLRWPLLKAPYKSLRLVEHALYVREVLHDRSELCTRQTAALILGRTAGTEGDDGAAIDRSSGRPMMSHVLRDLRQDVTYVFTLSARYPHIGRRDFEDALSSAPTSLKAAKAPLPVPIQLPLPGERLRRVQAAKCVLLKWSMAGLPDPAPADDDEEGVVDRDRTYDLQALPEGAGDHQWALCKNVARMKVDGVLAWLVKEMPGKALRYRFRLWERESGRLGRTSPLMLSTVEPVSKLGVSRTVSESAAQIVLRAPLGPYVSHDYICRYQVRYRPEKVDATWTELSVKMHWHRQNDHLESEDSATDDTGALVSGLGANLQQDGTAAADGDAVADEGAATTIGANVSRTHHFPAIPLATVGPHGDVGKQRCLVEILREEDGLEPTQAYVFSMRVGDLYRMAEWSAPSASMRLAVSPPVLDPALSAEDSQIRAKEVTDCSLVAEWPQFIPAVEAGVPISAEVEYMFAVIPQPPQRRLAGRGRPPDEAPQPHSQFILSSTLPRGTPAEQVGCGVPLMVTVRGLLPNSAYDLKLSVRYSRLGVRKWTEVLLSSAITKKMDGEAKKLMADRSAAEPVPLTSRDGSRPPLGPGDLEARLLFKGKADVKLQGLVAAAVVPSDYSPRRLPPLGTGGDVGAHGGTPPGTAETRHASVAAAGGRWDATPAEVEEWMTVAQGDTERVLGGGAAGGGLGSANVRSIADANNMGSVPATTAGAQDDPFARPADHVPFWRRDPSGTRPSMPAMPSPSHPAMQLDLMQPVVSRTCAPPATEDGAPCMRPRAPLVPRPPPSSGMLGRLGRPAEERTAYPRRIVYE